LDRRKIEYISPTALSLWTENPEEFYVQRIAPIKLDKEPQTKPMAIGAGFDAFVKAYIVTDILSKGRRAAASLKLEDFNITKIFEAQVEPHNRDWAWHECQYVFDAYMASGAYGRLARILLEATEINMEFKKQATVTSNGRNVLFFSGSLTLNLYMRDTNLYRTGRSTVTVQSIMYPRSPAICVVTMDGIMLNLHGHGLMAESIRMLNP
jgi:hypothetical protein